jgi:cytochrome c1
MRVAVHVRSLVRALACPVLVGLLAGCNEQAQRVAVQGNPEHGRAALGAYGCGACHRIPGVPHADGTIGPPLDALGKRVYLAGILANSPEQLAQWIREPQALKPATDMPNVRVTPADARDIAAYLWRSR